MFAFREKIEERKFAYHLTEDTAKFGCIERTLRALSLGGQSVYVEFCQVLFIVPYSIKNVPWQL